ncbi:uncharacterized protein TNCV_382641 [Trichonephila clavipes]|nr:uncharacterized protein TNCV_382641 [Trichonephila clavipes]
MNLPPPPTKFAKYNKMPLGATKDVCDATMKDAIEEAVQKNQNIRDIPVAVDGTWQKRGYSSMNGVVTITSVDTGKGIVDEWKSMELYRYFSALFNAMMCVTRNIEEMVTQKRFR